MKKGEIESKKQQNKHAVLKGEFTLEKNQELHWPASQVTLQSQNLLLRHFSLEDAKQVYLLANNRNIANNVANIPYPYTLKDAKYWIETHFNEFLAQKKIIYAITLLKNNQLMGAISLVEITPEHKRAELGYWLGERYWNKGYCTEATIILSEYVLQKLNFNKITAHHLIRNPASGKVLLNAGFTHEGTLRQHVFKNGIAEDIALYGKLRQHL